MSSSKKVFRRACVVFCCCICPTSKTPLFLREHRWKPSNPARNSEREQNSFPFVRDGEIGGSFQLNRDATTSVKEYYGTT